LVCCAREKSGNPAFHYLFIFLQQTFCGFAASLVSGWQAVASDWLVTCHENRFSSDGISWATPATPKSKCFEGQLPKNQSTIIIFFPLGTTNEAKRQKWLISLSFHRFNWFCSNGFPLQSF
jgi:hypothetical protein